MERPERRGELDISEWAKQQGCRKKALEAEVPVTAGFNKLLVDGEELRDDKKEARVEARIDRGLGLVTEVVTRGGAFWRHLREFARAKKLLLPDDEHALVPAANVPKLIPSSRQADRLIELQRRCEKAGFHP